MGRRKKYTVSSDKWIAFRQSKKATQQKLVRAYIPKKYREMLEVYCNKTGQTIGEAICTFLDTYFDVEEED